LKRTLLLLAALTAASYAAALYMTVTPDSHLVVLNSARDTLWKSTTGGTGSVDSLLRGVWFLNAGTWAKNGQTIAIDSAAVHAAGNGWGWGGGSYNDSANAHNERQADSGHIYYFANVHGDSAWVYYIGAHGGHVWYLGDSAILSSTSYVGAKVLDSLVATRYMAQKAQDTANVGLAWGLRDSVRLDGKLATGGKAADATKSDSALVSASTHALPDSNTTAPTVVSATRFRGAFIGNVTGVADTAIHLRGNKVDTSTVCTGNAASSDTCHGGAARATTAANATNAYNADSLGHMAAARRCTTATTPDSTTRLCGDGLYRYRGAWNLPQTLTVSSGRTSWNVALGGAASLTLTSNDTINNPTGLVNGTMLTLTVRQDSTGSRLLAWSSHYRFCGDTASTGLATAAPTLTATGWGGDMFSFLVTNDSMLRFMSFSPAIFRAVKP
jgi:hypothetical protein